MGRGVTGVDISLGSPLASRPLIGNILVYLEEGAWGSGWKKGQEGTESSQAMPVPGAPQG